MSFDSLTARLISALRPPPPPSRWWWGGAKEKEKLQEQEPIEELFASCRDELMPGRWTDGWYVVVATALLATSQPHHLRALYVHLTTTTFPPDLDADADATKHERHRLTLRLRDTLQKAWILTGIAPVLVGVAALAEGERELGHDNGGVGELSGRWKTAALDETSLARGQAFVQSLYAHNLAPTFANAWGSHLHDIRWQQESVIYGIFLSEHSILSNIETEMVTLSALMCGTIDPPKRWHLRGLRRLGVSRGEAEGVVAVVRRVAVWGGVGREVVACWPGPGDVEGEV